MWNTLSLSSRKGGTFCLSPSPATWGVLPQYLVGYGFASPTVSAGELARDPADYPLYHLINTDDFVPRIGSLNHLGVGLEYRANDTLRSAAYEWTDDQAEKERLEIGNHLLSPVKDTPTMQGRTLSPAERRVLTMDGCVGVASELCGFAEKYRPVMENLLGRTVIARDLDSGIRIMRFARRINTAPITINTIRERNGPTLSITTCA